MLGALSAEAAPEHLRGRYLSLIQLAWGLRRHRHTGRLRVAARPRRCALWLAVAGLTLVGAALAARLGRVPPHAGQRIANRR